MFCILIKFIYFTNQSQILQFQNSFVFNLIVVKGKDTEKFEM
jgi:hypothetical protein